MLTTHMSGSRLKPIYYFSLGRTVAENYDSSLYCDDMNVDLHGTNGVG